MDYKAKPFSEVLIGDIFQFNSALYHKTDSDMAIDLLDNEIEFRDDCVVLDLTNPIEEALKVEHLNAGEHEWSGDREIIPFSKVYLKERFSSLAVTYIKTSNSRLEDGSNALRMDDSTAYIANDRNVEVYR